MEARSLAVVADFGAGGDIEIKVVRIVGDIVRLRVDAPPEVGVQRKEAGRDAEVSWDSRSTDRA